jgi:hypothetical protein
LSRSGIWPKSKPVMTKMMRTNKEKFSEPTSAMKDWGGKAFQWPFKAIPKN